MAVLSEAFNLASLTFKIARFNSYQKLAIQKFVNQRQDVLVNLPTGSGKSLIVFDSVLKEKATQVSPLISLMENRINNLRSIGFSAVNISDPEVDGLRVEKGYSIR